MFRLTLLFTLAIYIVFAVMVARECAFLRPLLPTIWRDYQQPALLFSALFLFNSGATIYDLLRWVTLADTGAKLAHIEKGLRGRTTISQELTERLMEDQ